MSSAAATSSSKPGSSHSRARAGRQPRRLAHMMPRGGWQPARLSRRQQPDSISSSPRAQRPRALVLTVTHGSSLAPADSVTTSCPRAGSSRRPADAPTPAAAPRQGAAQRPVLAPATQNDPRLKSTVTIATDPRVVFSKMQCLNLIYLTVFLCSLSCKSASETLPEQFWSTVAYHLCLYNVLTNISELGDRNIET